MILLLKYLYLLICNVICLLIIVNSKNIIVLIYSIVKLKYYICIIKLKQQRKWQQQLLITKLKS